MSAQRGLQPSVTRSHRGGNWMLLLVFPIVVGGLLIAGPGPQRGLAAGDAAVSLALLFAACAVASRTTLHYETTERWLVFAAAVGASAGLIGWQMAMRPVTKIWEHGPDHFLPLVQSSQPLRAALFAAIGAASSVFPPLRHRLAELTEAAARAQDSADLHRDAELFKLRQQFGPHFLYNSLNSVSALVAIEPDKAQEMIGRLAHFMRASVRREMEERVPLADELSYLHEYLAIEAVRFGDRLMVRVEDDGACGDCTVPPFLLQPLLENAIKYGVYGTIGPVEISVAIARITSALRIVITNPFDPLTAPPSGTGFGLEGVGRRLTLLYGRADLIATAKADHTFTTTLTIPQNSRG